MTNGEVSDLMYEVFVLALRLAAPMLVISMLIGLIIAILQAATQIHEQTLTFLPKLLVIALILVFTGSSMLTALQDFTNQMFELMAAL
ncbi:MAG: flagellar biosynthesis protein FliQ [Lachnospiraceae bacterium]|jgi:flagellar biosynthetic protein FliQ|nr:flagellar biosynthesis protein FliQ [Lachnospiraceae bacterium]MCI9099590.1 flagellar biosynthesis protein FliQ [Lachnospiraceae bacterium]MCI9357152.1 flagellar biosynthesis protein FliQ [Lachnospiraceae bacterium]